MKKETLRQNLPAIIAISLPVLLVIVIGLLSILPSFGPKPAYDFIFARDLSSYHSSGSACTTYKNYYVIDNGVLTESPYQISVFDSQKTAEPCYGYSSIIAKDAPDLFVYKTATDTVSPISLEEASKLRAISGNLSPDGYSVSKRMMDRGIFELFGGANDSGVYISQKNRYIRTSIDPANNGSYYDNDFNLITWIDPIK